MKLNGTRSPTGASTFLHVLLSVHASTPQPADLQPAHSCMSNKLVVRLIEKKSVDTMGDPLSASSDLRRRGITHKLAMETFPLRLFRILGLAPYQQTGSAVTSTRWLRWYSVCVTLTSTIGCMWLLLYYASTLIMYPTKARMALAEVICVAMVISTAFGAALIRLYTVRRQYPLLHRVLTDPAILNEMPMTSSKALIIFYLDMATTVSIIILSLSVRGPLSPWVTSLHFFMVAEKLLETAELSLFMFTLDTLRRNYKHLNEEFTSLKQAKEKRKDITDFIVQLCFLIDKYIVDKLL
ncbi:uncharacterized protein LOC117639465 [Thrips palmi]|uniref:Uncharacterized protein LOC117639465 n=1 Tax=Thrips palmi TaxID=161013 RepID=A0A6P8YB75_THRPL|nr:uncharacterized protein LOC117639465 [Thrips palmi]